MDEDIHERVRAAIAAIPVGKVATYGDIATLTKAPSARLVGRILNEDGRDLPWQRVIRADGTAAPHLADEQLALLREEGIAINDGKVNLREYRWEAVIPDPADEPPALF